MQIKSCSAFSCILNVGSLSVSLLLIFLSSLYAEEPTHPPKQLFPQSLQSFSTGKQSKDKPIFSPTKNSYAVVNASALNLRSGPSTNNPVIKVLLEGTHILSLSSPKQFWLKVRIPHDIKGWVARKYIKFYRPRPLLDFTGKIDSMPFTSTLEASIIHYMKEMYDQKRLKPPDKLSIVVQDMTTGALVVSIRPRQSVKSASTIKVPILHAYMIQRFRGNIKDPLRYKKHIEEMIRYSSNSSANAIIKLLGGPDNIQQLLDETKIYNELRMTEAIPEDGRTYQNKISAADLNQIFVRIWSHRVIGSEFGLQKNRTASKEMLRLLELPGHSWLIDRIKARTCFSSNKSVKIWDKTGFVKGVNGNGGIVEIDSPHGRKAYSIAMFMERDDFHTINGDASQWSERMSLHMRRISEMTYAFISNRYESYNKCGRSLLIRYAKLALSAHLLQASL